MQPPGEGSENVFLFFGGGGASPPMAPGQNTITHQNATLYICEPGMSTILHELELLVLLEGPDFQLSFDTIMSICNISGDLTVYDQNHSFFLQKFIVRK